MNTRLMILGCVLALVAAGVLPVGAEIVDDFPEVVIFATNSIDIGANSTVFSGDVVANDLTPGVELTIGNKATFPAGWEVKADSLDVGNNVNFNGSVICNEGDALCSPGTLTQAVYGALPVHQSPGLPLGVLPVVVPKSGSGSITPGDYGDVSVGLEGTITFQGPGVFNIGSFTSGRKAQINVTGAWAEIRVHGDMNTGVEDNINVNAGAPSASEVIFYVAGDASLGSKTTVNANVYATGSLELESNFTGTGAFLATDIVIGQKSKFTLDTFFDFQPEADPDSASTLEDASVVIDVLANDSDPEGDPIFVNSFTQGGNGSVTCTGGGLGPCANGDTLTYTPNPDYFGPDSFTYEVCDVDTQINEDNCVDSVAVTVTVDSVNDPPNARDDSASTDEDTATTINVLANDDAGPANENQGLTLRVVSSSGTADVDGSNNVTYTPVPDFSGTDNLIYEICDGGQDDNLATDGDDLCDQATVTITVNPVNDDPVADPQAVATQGAAALTITLTGSDGDGDSLTFSITSGPDTGKGSLSGVTPVSSTSANVTYTPVNADNEENQFTFQVDDGSGTGTAIVTINPIETCASDSDCDAGFFCGTEGVCEPTPLGQIDARDQAVEANVDDLGAGIPVGILLNAAAPDTIGDLAFSLVGSPPATPPVSTATSPVRSATTTYTPSCTPAPVCTETFQFQACEVAAPTNCDTATVTIDVTTFEATPPVEARDQMVSTPMNTPVDIALSGGAGSCDPADPDCRPGTSAAVRGTTAPEARVRVSRGGTPDDTGAAPAGDTVALTNPRPGTSASRPVTRAAAPGEDLFAIDSDLDQLFAVNPTDGSATLQGSTSAGPTTPASLAFDGTKMFTIDLGGGGLYTLNVADGTPTFVCSTGIGGWQGVASDPTDEGQFYGITQSDELYKINRVNCATTLVASGVGGLIAALEFDADGTLWGAEFGSPGATTENAALVKIDKTSGAVTIVSQCATKPCTGSDNFLDGFQGIDFATDGTLYGANTNDDSLYIIDTADGSVTNLGAHGTPVFVKGLAFSELVLLEPGFTITTLPAVGTLSYLNPATGTQTSIASDDLPLLLPTEQVTYTPPTGATGDPLASFEYQQSDGLTADTGFIQLVVTGVSVIVDPCVAVGRPPGCNAGEAAGAGGENLSEISTRPETPGGVPNLRIVVEGKGTVTTSRRETRSGSVPGLSCGGECGGRFDAGAEVLLFARTLENSVFAGWAGDCSGSEPITTVRVGRRTTCIAIFEAD